MKNLLSKMDLFANNAFAMRIDRDPTYHLLGEMAKDISIYIAHVEAKNALGATARDTCIWVEYRREPEDLSHERSLRENLSFENDILYLFLESMEDQYNTSMTDILRNCRINLADASTDFDKRQGDHVDAISAIISYYSQVVGYQRSILERRLLNSGSRGDHVIVLFREIVGALDYILNNWKRELITGTDGKHYLCFDFAPEKERLKMVEKMFFF